MRNNYTTVTGREIIIIITLKINLNPAFTKKSQTLENARFIPENAHI